MFQISAMINLKTKFEGSSNCPCAKRNEEMRGSRRVCESRGDVNVTYKPTGRIYVNGQLIMNLLGIGIKFEIADSSQQHHVYAICSLYLYIFPKFIHHVRSAPVTYKLRIYTTVLLVEHIVK